MRRLLLPLFTFCSLLTFALTVPSTITNWKGGAKGAYSIIHDDYGNEGVDGIWQYADTIAANRALKFTFGAISADCEVSRMVAGQWQTPYKYAKDVMMAVHNHEIINHSHTHTCAIGRGWSPCDGTGWGELENSVIWNTQLKTSHSSITSGTGFTPKYYIFPYDQFTDDANTELASMGYIGSRTGWSVNGFHNSFYKYGYEANDENMFKCDAGGFFRTSVQVFDDADAGKSDSGQEAELNSVVDDAINNNEWGNRELHNVGATGWGTVSVNAYRAHLNYVQSKVNAGDLWMPTVSEALTYQIQKLVYTPNASYDATANEISVSFSEDKNIFAGSVESYLSSLTIKTSVTLELNVADYTGLIDFTKAKVFQGPTQLTDVRFINDKLYVEVYPHEGSLTVTEGAPSAFYNVAELEEFQIFPNPAQNVLNVQGVTGRIFVYDASGAMVLESSQAKIDVSALSAGVYFVKASDLPIQLSFIKL